MIRLNRIINILRPLIGAIFIISILLLLISFGWIVISEYQFSDYFEILQLVLKNGGSYSALLAAITATVFFQSYQDTKKQEKEKNRKVESIGHFAICFRESNIDNNNDEYFVVMIENNNDFTLKGQGYISFKLEFLTSRHEQHYLRNLMAFEANYFKQEQKKIINRYFDYCQKTDYPSPILIKAFPYKDVHNLNEAAPFTLLINTDKKKSIELWLTAITEEGILYFNKIKLRIDYNTQTKNTEEYSCVLLQQTNYYAEGDKLIPLIQ